MKFLRIMFCFAMVLAAGTLLAAPGLNSIRQKVSLGSKLWETDPQKAQQLLSVAFADAIAWTGNDYVESVREQAFFLAISCFSPDLIDQVAIAADTYLKVFPRGKNLKKVNLYRAMAAYAQNEPEIVAASINAAVASAGKFNYSQQTFALSGYLGAGKHRSAEHFIEGQRLTKPSLSLKKDLKRFHSGNRLVEGLLKKVADGKLSGLEAVVMLEAAIASAPFAKEAPRAALTALRIRDQQAPYFNSLRTEWCGLERIVKHAASPQIRLKKLIELVNDFKEAPSAEYFKALVQLYYLYKLEFKDAENAATILTRMFAVREFSQLARIESILARFNMNTIRTEDGFNDLEVLANLAHLLPYDNGIMPVITLEFVEYLTAIADMILDKKSHIDSLHGSGWQNLSKKMLYLAACDKKDSAYELFKAVEAEQTPQIRKLFKDLVMPLYTPVRAKDRMFLAGLAVVEDFPDLGTDLIIEALSGYPAMLRIEHGLAALSDVYSRHMAYAEAQKVWKTLVDFYPDSVWLK